MRKLLVLAVCVIVAAIAWQSVKPVVAGIAYQYLSGESLDTALALLKPIEIPAEYLHNDAHLEPSGVRSLVVSALPVACDGDGVTGYRFQLVYARSSDVASRYDAYKATFQQIASEIDDIFLFSAGETGGTRRVRWVHDAACYPTVIEVVMTPTGDDNFANTISEMGNQGYNSPDRNYAVFVDAHVYCGVANIQYDDRPDPAININNNAPRYARVDNGCWNSIPMGHEVMHTLGAVQVSAPHSSLEWHCWDVDDLMCRPTNGTPTQQLCSWVNNQRYDCNHDDYFSTNPEVGSYLDTHWNTANNQFLIGAPAVIPTPTPCFRGNSGKPCRK